MNAVDIKGLTFSYGNEPILKNVSLELPENSFLVVIGPNGGGKSTLIKLILGLLPLQQGSIKIFGDSLEKMRSIMGYVPQDSDQIKHFPVNVLDTAMMGLFGHKLSKHQQQERAMESLNLLGMDSYADKRLNELSTGQRQRVLMARALAAEPKLLILDEPTSGIDPSGQEIILDVLKNKAKDTTIIFISHDLSVIPGHASAVACVNRDLHYHASGEVTNTIMSQAYGNIPSMTLVCHECQYNHETDHGERQ